MLLHCLKSALDLVKTNAIPQDAELRKETLKLARSLVAALEQPEEVVMRWGFEVRVTIYGKSQNFRVLTRGPAGFAASMSAPRYRPEAVSYLGRKE